MNIPVKYDSKFVEKEIYEKWMKGNYFLSFPDNRIPYTIIMPPPNITGILHIGHMLNNTIQDVLIRHARMNGYNVCWIPGIDHASIATEAKVSEKLYKEKGLNKFDLGRKKFISYVLQWVDKHKYIIYDQIKRLGCSCDWNRIKFTMDDKLYKSVIKSFVKFYKEGYIYRGYKVVNWDTVAKTTISDEEVIYKKRTENLYYIKYKIENENNYIIIATTRPETIFGDTAVCFNPKDERFFHIKGKRVIVPIINRSVPVIQDSLYADINFGTGCFKVTPAHDLKDKILSDKYKLDIINIFNEDATINDNGFHYKGIDRFIVRKMIIKELNDLGFLLKIEKIIHNIGFSERTFSIIEYIPSTQWFLKMNKIVKPAIKAVVNEDVQFYPKKYKKIYFQWMNKIRDWNISRQLWWGHRIPVYYYGKGYNDFVVEENIEKALIEAKRKTNNYKLTFDDLNQEMDVLDTWFSSWLLPISFFDGIINPNNFEISYYYPTDNLITGSDILFFWVARMIISGLYFNKKIPFKKVFFTGIIRDSNNKKISKSLNNSPDYIYLIDKYGADAVRFSMILKNVDGKDFHFDEKIFIQGRNFINKIWNSFRLIQSWIDKNNCSVFIDDDNNIEFISDYVSYWIKNRFYHILEMSDKNIKKLRLNKSLMIIYKFFWNDFCSIYLEIIKIVNKKNFISSNVLNFVINQFKEILKLFHPYIPFISEKIWGIINEKKIKNLLIISSWPKKNKYDINLLISFKRIINIVSKIRNIRNENNIPDIHNFILFSMKKESKECKLILLKLVNVSKVIHLSEELNNSSFLYFFILNSEKFFLSIEEKKILKHKNYTNKNIINVKKKILHFKKMLFFIEKNLSNSKYILSVPKHILMKERKKKVDTIEKIKFLEKYLKFLK